jgi:hypothetical protein
LQIETLSANRKEKPDPVGIIRSAVEKRGWTREGIDAGGAQASRHKPEATFVLELQNVVPGTGTIVSIATNSDTSHDSSR